MKIKYLNDNCHIIIEFIDNTTVRVSFIDTKDNEEQRYNQLDFSTSYNTLFILNIFA